MIREPAVWAVVVSRFCSEWSATLVSNFVPTLISQQFNITDLTLVGYYMAIPFGVQVLSSDPRLLPKYPWPGLWTG